MFYSRVQRGRNECLLYLLTNPESIRNFVRGVWGHLIWVFFRKTDYLQEWVLAVYKQGCLSEQGAHLSSTHLSAKSSARSTHCCPKGTFPWASRNHLNSKTSASASPPKIPLYRCHQTLLSANLNKYVLGAVKAVSALDSTPLSRPGYLRRSAAAGCKHPGSAAQDSNTRGMMNSQNQPTPPSPPHASCKCVPQLQLSQTCQAGTMPRTSSQHKKAPPTKGAWLQGWTGDPSVDETDPRGPGLPWPSTALPHLLLIPRLMLLISSPVSPLLRGSLPVRVQVNH